MSRFQANCLLLLTAFIWGTTFVAQKMAVSGFALGDQANHVGPMTFSGLRFLIGAAVVAPLAWRERRQSLRGHGPRGDRSFLVGAVVCGGCLLGGSFFQQLGISQTSVANAGFLTALYVPLVPLLTLLVFRQWPHWGVWPAVICSVSGAFLLSGGSLGGFGIGDRWVLLGTLFWAWHVIAVGRVVGRCPSPLRLAVVQFTVCGIVGTLLGGLSEPVSWHALTSIWFELAYAGVLSVGIAFTLQVVGQTHTHPAAAAVILSTEMVFAAVAGMVVLGESLSVLQVTGAALILGGVFLVDVLPFMARRRGSKAARDEMPEQAS